MRIAAEQPLVLAQRRFDLDILRQHGDVVHPQPVRGLAFGLQEVLDAVLGHDPRRLESEGAA